MSKKTVDPRDLPYRPCVGIMVLNASGLVWAGRRIAEPDSELSNTDQLWQMPQGGIDKGEEPYPAAVRELYEETGMRSVKLLAEAPGWINYDLPEHLIGVALKGKYRGQTQKWYAFRFEGDEGEIAIDYTKLPTERADGWPDIIPNEARLGKLVYSGMVDHMRGICETVSIGRAAKGGKMMDAWFVLVRQDPEA